MAYKRAYIRSGGSDANAGTSSSTTATFTSANGDWDSSVANRFIAASGTPFSVNSVGDIIGLRADGDTVCKMWVEITAINGGGASVDVHATRRLGTLAGAATGITAVHGGAWATETPLHTGGALATGTAPWSIQIDIWGGTTYTTGAARTFALVGDTTNDVLIRGVKSDGSAFPDDATTTMAWSDHPKFALSTNQMTLSGTYRVEHIWFSGAINNANGQVNITGGGARFDVCKFENTNATANGHCVNTTTSTVTFCRCEFVATTTSTLVIKTASTIKLFACYVTGGITCMSSANANFVYEKTLFKGYAQYGIQPSAAGEIIDCTFDGGGTATGDAIRVTATTALVHVRNALVLGHSTASTYCVNSSAGSSRLVRVFGLAHYNCNAAINGITESYAKGIVALGSNPITGSGDYSLVANSSAFAVAYPGTHPDASFRGYMSFGAFQSRRSDNTVLAAIEAQTDLIPASPAATGDIPTAAQIADAVWDEATSGHTTPGTYGVVTTADDLATAIWSKNISAIVGANFAATFLKNADVATSEVETKADTIITNIGLLPGDVWGYGSGRTLSGDQSWNHTGTIADKDGYALAADGLDTISTAAPTGVASDFREMMVQVWRRFFKKATRTAGTGQFKTFADNGTDVLTTQATTDDLAGNESMGAAS